MGRIKKGDIVTVDMNLLKRMMPIRPYLKLVKKELKAGNGKLEVLDDPDYRHEDGTAAVVAAGATPARKMLPVLTLPHLTLRTLKENKMKRSELRQMIREVLSEYYQPKVNGEKETITFVNDAEVKKATAQLKAKGITPKIVFGKTLKFLNTAEFKKAKSIIGV